MAAPTSRMIEYATYRGVKIYRCAVYRYFEAYVLDGYALRTHIIDLFEYIDSKIPTTNGNTNSTPTSSR